MSIIVWDSSLFLDQFLRAVCWLKLRLATGAFIRVFSSCDGTDSHLLATAMSMRDGNNGAAPKAENRAIPTTPSTIRAPSVNTEPSVGTSLSITDSDVSQSPDQIRLATAAQKLASQLPPPWCGGMAMW